MDLKLQSFFVHFILNYEALFTEGGEGSLEMFILQKKHILEATQNMLLHFTSFFFSLMIYPHMLKKRPRECILSPNCEMMTLARRSMCFYV